MFFLLFIFYKNIAKKTAEEEDKAIVDNIKQNSKQTSINIKQSLGLACSTRTIIRRFNAAGYKHHILAI